MGVASKLHEIAYSIAAQRVNSQYTDIIDIAERAANEGKLSVHYYESLLEGTHKQLITDGFNVLDGSAMNETLYTISW